MSQLHTKRSDLIGKDSPNQFQVVAIGASAGGIQSLDQVLRVLGSDFPCGVLVVLHLHPQHKTLIDRLLANVTDLRVKMAMQGEPIHEGVVYLAPPDRHLLVREGCVELTDTKVVEWVRPSVDVLFESVAGWFGSGSIGVVLSGSLRDGATGIRRIKEAGGVTMAEDPAQARFAGMPSAAVSTGCVDFVLPLPQLGPMLLQLTRNQQTISNG
jgi:two-component system, chemotaxis family, protein-glutamate methylesterase/glutaminase